LKKNDEGVYFTMHTTINARNEYQRHEHDD
jgi:hypothetical protein